MVWVLTIVACLGALFLLLLVWGFFHLRQSQRQALDEIGRIEIGDIPSLARECVKAGGEITARIGIQGRVIAGPAGAPTTIEVPLRVAVVQGGVGEKVIATKAYTTTVTMSESESVPFTFVAEDLVYPEPVGRAGENYLFYVGFDPQLVSAEKAKPARKKK